MSIFLFWIHPFWAPAQEGTNERAKPSLGALPRDPPAFQSRNSEGKLDCLLQSHLQHPPQAHGQDSDLLIHQQGLQAVPQAQA